MNTGCPCGAENCPFYESHVAYDEECEKEAFYAQREEDNDETSGSTNLGNDGGITFCY